MQTNIFISYMAGAIIGLLFAVGPALGQQPVVMKLKNGAVIRGRVLPQTQDSTVLIQVYDKSIWAFKRADVASTTPDPHPTDPALRYKQRGFVHYTELGPLAGSNRASNGTTTSAFSFQLTNGYKFNQWFYAGLGIGADLYAVQTFVPIVLSLRGDFTQHGDKIPYYFLEGGYSLNATSNDVLNLRYRGGPTAAAGLGLKILFRNNTGFTVGVGYRYQRSETEQTTGLTTDEFNRITLRAGFSF
jgi:hypothetical protein